MSRGDGEGQRARAGGAGRGGGSERDTMAAASRRWRTMADSVLLRRTRATVAAMNRDHRDAVKTRNDEKKSISENRYTEHRYTMHDVTVRSVS